MLRFWDATGIIRVLVCLRGSETSGHETVMVIRFSDLKKSNMRDMLVMFPVLLLLNLGYDNN